MVWGGMGSVRIATLIFAAALMTGLYWILRKKTEKTQTLVLGVLSLLGITAILYNLCGGYPVQELPLHLCSFNAMVLPVAVFTRNKTLGNLLLVWSLGALSALVLPFELVNTKLLSWDFFFYFFPMWWNAGSPSCCSSWDW
ncbi:MAG: YwaF family protein [Firmicutes bacterium]|nr:YwaF family protein [Bacillota bacterium]